VASFAVGASPPDHLAQRVNAVAPPDLAVIAAEPVADGFDARRDAHARTYCYRVLASEARSPFEEGRALWWPHPLEPARLRRCAELVRGTHDFTAFTPTQTDHVRFEREILRAEWILERSEHAAGIVSFWVEADAFMRHMVRVLVGTMLEVAGERRSVDDFARLLDGAPREAAGETAPPWGLYLAAVSY
jgi:tRNA pseudouridine38-40 synthase